MLKRLWKINETGFYMKQILSGKRIVLIIGLITGMLAISKNGHGQVSNFPVPAADTNRLFYLQRTPNTNTIVYELNYDKGVLNEKEPVHVFWIRYGEQGQRAELSFIQRSFAYGVKTKAVAKDRYELRFVSYKKAAMQLVKAADNKYHIYATINQKMAILNRIFIHINGGSFWSPNIEYVDLEGIDPATGKGISERRKI